MHFVSQQTDCTAPRLSVAMITYNHRKFIAQAIESVLMQEVDFKVELVIGEDCSTDGTRQIVRQYAERYPGAIRPLFPEHNLGAIKNAVTVLSSCKGEFLAVLEGDDFWTDPTKLAKQVRLLDTDSKMPFCFHPVVHIDESRPGWSCCFPTLNWNKTEDIVAELLRWNFIPTNSIVYRRSKIPAFDREFHKLKLGDWPTTIIMTMAGKPGFILEVMGTYRFHPGGIWSGLSHDTREFYTYEMFYYFFKRSEPLYKREIAEQLLAMSRRILEASRSKGIRFQAVFIPPALRASYRIGLSKFWDQMLWLLFYFALSERKKPSDYLSYKLKHFFAHLAPTFLGETISEKEDNLRK